MDIQRDLCLPSHAELLPKLLHPFLLGLSNATFTSQRDPRLSFSLDLLLLLVILRQDSLNAEFSSGPSLPPLKHLLLERTLQLDVLEHIGILLFVVLHDHVRVLEGHDVIVAFLQVGQTVVDLDTRQVPRCVLLVARRHYLIYY